MRHNIKHNNTQEKTDLPNVTLTSAIAVNVVAPRTISSSGNNFNVTK